jgi:hypothetical protein
MCAWPARHWNGGPRVVMLSRASLAWLRPAALRGEVPGLHWLAERCLDMLRSAQNSVASHSLLSST